MLENDEEAFLQDLKDSELHGAALVFARSRGLSEDGINFDQGEMKTAISTGKALKISKRTKPLEDWPLKQHEEI